MKHFLVDLVSGSKTVRLSYLKAIIDKRFKLSVLVVVLVVVIFGKTQL